MDVSESSMARAISSGDDSTGKGGGVQRFDAETTSSSGLEKTSHPNVEKTPPKIRPSDQAYDLPKDLPVYKKVAVLTLSWHLEVDELKVQPEVDALSALFSNSFNYLVTNIILHPHQNLQVKVNAILTQFVLDNDGPEHLLIVYYAGLSAFRKTYGDFFILP